MRSPRRHGTRTSKYGAVKTEVDGVVFASKREARCYQDLKLRQLAGEVFDLTLQPRFPLIVNDVKVADYIGDFSFVEGTDAETGARIVADAKGFTKNPVYRLKKKLVKAIYGIDIREL